MLTDTHAPASAPPAGVVTWAVDAAARRAVALRAAERRAYVAAAVHAARDAVARSQGPGPRDDSYRPPSDDPSDSLEDGGIEEDEDLVKQYMAELGGLSAGADEDAAARAPMPPMPPLPAMPFGGGGDGGTLLLALGALAAASAAPLADVADAVAVRTRLGRRLLVTGSLRRPGRRAEDVTVSTFDRVAGWSLHGQPATLRAPGGAGRTAGTLLPHAGGSHQGAPDARVDDDADADDDAPPELSPPPPPRPLFVADLGLDQLAGLLR
jgi:hypothetical protein